MLENIKELFDAIDIKYGRHYDIEIRESSFFGVEVLFQENVMIDRVAIAYILKKVHDAAGAFNDDYAVFFSMGVEDGKLKMMFL